MSQDRNIPIYVASSSNNSLNHFKQYGNGYNPRKSVLAHLNTLNFKQDFKNSILNTNKMKSNFDNLEIKTGRNIEETVSNTSNSGTNDVKIRVILEEKTGEDSKEENNSKEAISNNHSAKRKGTYDITEDIIDESLKANIEKEVLIDLNKDMTMPTIEKQGIIHVNELTNEEIIEEKKGSSYSIESELSKQPEKNLVKVKTNNLDNFKVFQNSEAFD